MFSFRFKILEKCAGDAEALAVWEVSALFRGRLGVDDLSVDRDAAVEWYISERVLDDCQEDYFAEPQMAEDEMLEMFEAELIDLARLRAGILGDHYPLALDEHGKLVLKPLDKISASGAVYLCLQFFRVWNSGLVEIDLPDGRRDGAIQNFNKWFTRAFEMIASYAVSGSQSGVPYMTSASRSSQRLHKLLSILCVRVGSGRAKRYEDWSPAQRASNDGGIDCIVHCGGPGMPGNAHLILVGATVQASQIDAKILGEDARRRFSDFFAERPGAFQAALVRPTDGDALTADKCRSKDCLFFGYEEIWKSLGERVSVQGSKKRFSAIDCLVRRHMRKLNDAKLIDGFDQYTLKLPGTSSCLAPDTAVD